MLSRFWPTFEPTGKARSSSILRAFPTYSFARSVVAFKRCVDYIPLAIDMEFVRGFRKGLSGLLFQELGVSGRDADKKCSEYLSEPLEIVIKRKELRDSLKLLEEARDAIDDWAANGA